MQVIRKTEAAEALSATSFLLGSFLPVRIRHKPCASFSGYQCTYSRKNLKAYSRASHHSNLISLNLHMLGGSSNYAAEHRAQVFSGFDAQHARKLLFVTISVTLRFGIRAHDAVDQECKGISNLTIGLFITIRFHYRKA